MTIRSAFIALVLAAASCAAPASFVLTGSARTARAEDAPIKPYLTGMPQGPYEEIGVVEVRGHDLEDRVERAAEVARLHGGNAIILLSSSVQVESSPVGGGGALLVPGPYYYGAFAVRTPTNAVRSYEVDRYIVAYVAHVD